MATGIRLTPNGAGCPPTATPPSDYTNPFYEDSSGALWVKSCFPGFMYFGAARHDVSTAGVPGQNGYPVNTSPDIYKGPAVTAGVATTRTITNTTNCTLGFLLTHDVITDITSNHSNMILLRLSERWNNQNHALAAVSTEFKLGYFEMQRQLLHNGASPHDVNRDANGGASLTLAPGESATVGARLILQYAYGSPAPGELIHSSSSAVRIYGYVLG